MVTYGSTTDGKLTRENSPQNCHSQEPSIGSLRWTFRRKKIKTLAGRMVLLLQYQNGLLSLKQTTTGSLVMTTSESWFFLESSRKVVLSFLVLMKVWRSKITVYDSSEILFLERAQHRREIRMIESNAKCRYLKKLACKGTLRQVFICLRHPPLLGFCLGWLSIFVGSECGQKQSVKLLQNMVSNTTQHHPIPFQIHTACIHSTLTWERGEGLGKWTREKVRGTIVHKAGSKIPTWLTVSPVYNLYLTPVKTTFSFGVFLIYLSMPSKVP
jgi:hypothetical protein